MCTLYPVAFHGDTIFCIDYQNQPFTPMRPIVENMGLDWGGQAVKLKANKERWTVEIISTVAQDGVEREMLSMPVRKLPAWLNSINPKKVRPELRPKIELYQAESDDALWNYWMNGMAERAEAASKSGLSPAFRAELKALVDAKLSSHPASVQGKARAEIWTRFNRHFGIAEYVQLPAEKMPEARDFIIELRVRALKALPPDTQKELPPAKGKDKFEACMDEVEAFRARTTADLRRLLDEGLNLVVIQKLGVSGIVGFTNIFQHWLEQVAVTPVPLIASWQGIDRAIDFSPLCLIKRFASILEERER